MSARAAAHDAVTQPRFAQSVSRTPRRTTATRRRVPLVIAALIGAALVAVPFSFGMFTRAPQGAAMLRDFRPFMRDARLARFQHYMTEIELARHETNGPLRSLLQHRGVDHVAVRSGYATFDSFQQQWPAIDRDMSQLLRSVRSDLGAYHAMASMPSFTLFPWAFVVPGVLVVALCTIALIRGPRRGRLGVLAAAALGTALAVGPVAIGMVQRAPQGADMMAKFAPIMRRQRVHTMQGYFGTMSVGEGALRLQLLPAARRAGTGSQELAQRFPAVHALERDWITIMNEMTPMIGAMSDNVDRYHALRALPPFTAFPWIFVVSGSAIAICALVAARRPRPKEFVC